MKKEELLNKSDKELLIELIEETKGIRRNVQFFFYLFIFTLIAVIGLRYS
jgi:hypothetical protein